MQKLQIKRGTTAQILASTTNLVGELFLATDTLYLYVATGSSTVVQFSKYSDIAGIVGNVYTKDQVDLLLQGLSWKNNVQAASVGYISSLYGLQTIDGISLSVGDRILVKNQGNGTNGIYVVGTGAWTRATDADTNAELQHAVVCVEYGIVNADSTWIQCVSSLSIGVSPIEFVKFSGLGQISVGTGLGKTGNMLLLDFTQFSENANAVSTDYIIIQSIDGLHRISTANLLANTVWDCGTF